MIEPPIPEDETWRLAALRNLGILDTPREPDFDAVVQLGQAMFGVPMCLISLIDQDRQWFKACVGLDASETARAISFCAHAILEPEVFVILDAAKDERFHDNPVVTGDPFVRFYAGAQIRLPSGYTIGTVCLVSPEPRTSFGAAEIARLEMLAGQALNAITVRALGAELDRARGEAMRYQTALQLASAPFALLDAEGRVVECNPGFLDLCGGEDPEGRQLDAALSLPAGAWDPARAGEEEMQTLDAGGRTLRIYREPGGFTVSA
jgi:GAF domain-containing protein